MDINDMTPIQYYTYTYPQLSLDVKEGESKSEEYLNIVRFCRLPENPEFPLKETGHEERITMKTPAGEIEILYLPDRTIFERFVRVLAYRCEPADIPRSTGAMMISGINNIRKYLKQEENYKDAVLLVSAGNYSNIPPEKAGYDESEWLRISKQIRLYHESAHFVQRKLYPEHKEAIRDEVIADTVGIIGALGKTDHKLCRIVLGVDEEKVPEGARIRNYVDGQDPKAAADYAGSLIDRLDAFIKEYQGKEEGTLDPFAIEMAIEDAYIR